MRNLPKSHNGDGGSRTRVQTHRHLKIYVHSQLICGFALQLAE